LATPFVVPFGPTGEIVYKRTYSREKADRTFETWPETVRRVVHGNLALVYGYRQQDWSMNVHDEYTRLVHYMDRFAIIPAGRQLWATGVPGREYLFNCHVSGWGETLAEHFAFTFMRLVEGGGVGANYSSKHVEKYGPPRHPVSVVLTCDEDHPDYDKMREYLTPKKDFDPKVAQEHYKALRGTGVVEDTREGWAEALRRLIDVSMSIYGVRDRGVTVYFDLSKIRREGAPLVSSGGVAAGPAPLAKMLTDVATYLSEAHADGCLSAVRLMEIEHAVAVGAVAGGKRRSARMSICHWDDPYVFDFIDCKQDSMLHWSTNISVEIDDAFFEALADEEVTARRMQAEDVHRAVCEAVLKNGEPGYWNSSLSNIGEVGTIIATNPCGEIPLEAWEACNLGHVNMDYFAPKPGTEIDHESIEEAHRLITRFLIRSTYSDINDPVQKVIQDRNRRIGVGHHGVQGFWAKLGVRYSDIAAFESGGVSSRSFLKNLYEVVRKEAREYAFAMRIAEPVKVTCIAPGGTTPKLAGITEAIGAIYARWFEQRVRFSLRDEAEFNQVSDYRAQGFKVEEDIYDPSGMTAVVVFPTENVLVKQVRDEWGLPEDIVQSADELTVRDMLEMQAYYQECWADNAISYTCNIPEGTVTPEELSGILREYLPRLKGTTIMVDATREQAPYTRISQEAYTVSEARRVADAVNEECSSGACPIR
jgi:ribonucleoside-diphosphate reductase alpha chain